jgi:hypothetical protein
MRISVLDIPGPAAAALEYVRGYARRNREHQTSTGLSVAANGSTYWVGEAMQATDYADHASTPDKTASTTRTAAANTAHLARLLKGNGYPPA